MSLKYDKIYEYNDIYYAKTYKICSLTSQQCPPRKYYYLSIRQANQCVFQIENKIQKYVNEEFEEQNEKQYYPLCKSVLNCKKVGTPFFDNEYKPEICMNKCYYFFGPYYCQFISFNQRMALAQCTGNNDDLYYDIEDDNIIKYDTIYLTDYIQPIFNTYFIEQEEQHEYQQKYCDYYQDTFYSKKQKCSNCNSKNWFKYSIRDDLNNIINIRICKTQNQKCEKYFIQINQNQQQCVDKCKDENTKISYYNIQQCVYNCNYDEKEFVWSYKNGDYYCRNSSVCNNNEYLITQTYECIDNPCLDKYQFKYIKNQNKTCQQINCKYYSYINNKDIQCFENCDGIYYKQTIKQNGTDGYIYICQQNNTHCPPITQNNDDQQHLNGLTKQHGNQCVKTCQDEKFYHYLDKYGERCVSFCIDTQYYYQTDDGDLQCLSTECPPQQYPKRIKQYQGVPYDIYDQYECVENCKNKQQLYKNDESRHTCTHDCRRWEYNETMDENVCRLFCNNWQYTLSDTKECINLENNQCPNISNKQYIKNDTIQQCILVNNTCRYKNAYYIDQYTKNQDKQHCTLECDGVWFLQKINNDKNVRICRDYDNCPPYIIHKDNETSINRLIINKNNQCIEKCEDDGKYIYYLDYLDHNICKSYDDCDIISKFVQIKDQVYLYCSNQTGCQDVEQNKIQQIKTVLYKDGPIIDNYMCVDQCQYNIQYQFYDQYQCIQNDAKNNIKMQQTNKK